MHERAVWIFLCDLGGQNMPFEGPFQHPSSVCSILVRCCLPPLLLVLFQLPVAVCSPHAFSFRGLCFTPLLLLSLAHTFALTCRVQSTMPSGPCLVAKSFKSHPSPKIIQAQTFVLSHQHHALSLVSTLYFAQPFLLQHIGICITSKYLRD